jgi:hypothetical protein
MELFATATRGMPLGLISARKPVPVRVAACQQFNASQLHRDRITIPGITVMGRSEIIHLLTWRQRGRANSIGRYRVSFAFNALTGRDPGKQSWGRAARAAENRPWGQS